MSGKKHGNDFLEMFIRSGGRGRKGHGDEGDGCGLRLQVIRASDHCNGITGFFIL